MHKALRGSSYIQGPYHVAFNWDAESVLSQLIAHRM